MTSVNDRLSDDEIQFFHENGFAGPFQLCSPEEMAGYRPEFYNNVLGQVSPLYGFETVRDWHLCSPTIHKLVTHPVIANRLTQLLGPDILIWRSDLFPKPPGAPETVWHQANLFKEFVDVAILDAPDANDLFQLTVWIAIDDSMVKNGCMQFLPGTHKVKLGDLVDKYGKVLEGGGKEDIDQAPQKDAFGHKKEGFFGYGVDLKTTIDPDKVVNCPCKAGEFFIFTQRTLHASLPNVSDRPRLGLNFRAIKTDVKAYSHYLADAKIEHYGKVFSLEKWGCVLLAGEDNFHYNKMADLSLLKQELQPA
jgi:non-heme Fe2+,alpha-ketoglutarate-dependent halogenase